MDSAAISNPQSSLSIRKKLRAWMVLGRISNLPTVWSNCLAGCWLAGWNTPVAVLRLCLGGSLLYIGGMFLNDVCDVKFDAEFRRERPIVSGAITRSAAIIATLLLFVCGIVLIGGINKLSGLLALGLTTLIIVYDWMHKDVPSAPLLMGGCRFLLYLTAAAAGLVGITPRVLFFGAMLGIYVSGLSYVARNESKPGKSSRYFWLLLFVPILGGLVLDHSSSTTLRSLPLILCISWAMIASRSNIGRAVGLLLAGIALVDLIAISTNPMLMVNCLVLFAITLLFQKNIPAT